MPLAVGMPVRPQQQLSVAAAPKSHATSATHTMEGPGNAYFERTRGRIVPPAKPEAQFALIAAAAAAAPLAMTSSSALEPVAFLNAGINFTSSNPRGGRSTTRILPPIALPSTPPRLRERVLPPAGARFGLVASPLSSARDTPDFAAAARNISRTASLRCDGTARPRTFVTTRRLPPLCRPPLGPKDAVWRLCLIARPLLFRAALPFTSSAAPAHIASAASSAAAQTKMNHTLRRDPHSFIASSPLVWRLGGALFRSPTFVPTFLETAYNWSIGDLNFKI